MKFDDARDQLMHAIQNQKTIAIPKLKMILNSMHVTYKCTQSEKQIKYLKDELHKLREKHNKVMRFAKKRGYKDE